MIDMSKIERDSSSMEPAVKPLLEAANTQHWVDALNILYLSGHVINLSEKFYLPCLVSAIGPYDEIELSMDLLKGKAIVKIAPLVKEFMRFFLPRFISVYRKTEVIDAIKEENEERVSMLIITELLPEWDKLQNKISKILIQGASTISDMVTIGFFNELIEIRDKYIRSVLYEDEYEEMIASLIGLNLLEVELQISLCPNCANYQIIISRHPNITTLCPKCGSEWATITLYSLRHPFSEVKKHNSDLPLFISSCFKHKVNLEAPMGEIEIFPLAKIKMDDERTFDIDVFIPNYNVGIECKVFDDAYAPMSKARIGSIVGNLIPQIKNYFDFGITKVIIVTNLIDSSKDKVETALKKKLIDEGYPDNIEVLPKNINTLLEWMNEKSKIIVTQINESFTKALEEIPKYPSLTKNEKIE